MTTTPKPRVRRAQMIQALKGIDQKLTELLERRTMDSTIPDFYVVRNARNQARAILKEIYG